MSSAYDGHLSREGNAVSEEEVQEMAKQKAHELFNVCDIEQKGFITKRDMQRLQNELPLMPDQLEAVFDSLDDDGNGYLTLEEFTEGFGSYLGINFMGESQMEGDDTLENVYEEDADRQDEEKQFSEMMENIGAKSLFDDENTIKHLWMRMRKDEPEMVGNFEDFLYKISSDLQRTKTDFSTLENALKSKSSAHDEEVRKLYEEMEYQIKKEKERILGEEQLKERQIREALEKDLQEKDKQLQELLNRQAEMEKKLESLNLTESETKQENEKLAKEKDELEDLLLRSKEEVDDSKMYIDQLRQQQKKEKQERARAAIKLTESIALERESLVKQLDTLKDVNKRLRDDKDEAEIRRDESIGNDGDNLQQILEAEASPRSNQSRKKELIKQGSILGDYFPASRRKFETTEESIEESIDDSREGQDLTDDDFECDDDELIAHNNNNLMNDFTHGDSDNQIKPSYYGNFSAEKSDQSVGSESEEENDGNLSAKKSRTKPKKKKSKKPGFHPISMQSKPSVAPPSGDGDSFEESGDNIDMIVAPAFEDDLTCNTGENLSLYFPKGSEPLVETVDSSVQTFEEMVPKSEIVFPIAVSSVDSSTNTELIDENLDLDKNLNKKLELVDCSTNTDIDTSSQEINQSTLVEIATNTDQIEEFDEKMTLKLVTVATNTDEIEDISENLTPALVTMATNTDIIEEINETSKPEMVTIATNTEEEYFKQSEEIKPQTEPLVDTEGTRDPVGETDTRQSMLDLDTSSENNEALRNENSQNIDVIKFTDDGFDWHSPSSSPSKKSRLQRKERVTDSRNGSIELNNLVSNVGVTSNVLEHSSRNVKPLIGRDGINFPENPDELQGTRGQPVGADGEGIEKGVESTVSMRQRIFKIVFVGDSGVGKSSFIHRFCNDSFNAAFSATIGVDFQVKNLVLGGQSIVLQLWDTAGQERFRSITKQYFRKADGVVIMYDVNSESTFTNVRNWMESVQEGVEEGTVILMLGNKTDMTESEADRPVKHKDGNKLSCEYDGMFYETSAKSGINVRESMEAMANILREKEDKELEKALNLDDQATKKKFCCG